MKKQILIFATFTLAIMFAGMRTYGQQNPNLTADQADEIFCPTPIAINPLCGGSSHINPIPGQPYTYEIDVTTGTTDGGTIHWFVTPDPEFITGGVLTTDIETDVTTSPYIQAIGATYNVTTNTTPTVDITWKYFTEDVFLVAYVNSDPTCTDNIQAYKIRPAHSFTLDIAAIQHNGTGWGSDPVEDCVSPVVSAIYDPDLGADGEIEMDYGFNYMYFAVNAANFSHSWRPSFTLQVDNSTSTTREIHWAYPAESYEGATPINWHDATLAEGVYSSTDVVEPQTEGATGVGSDGECIIVRVLVDHDNDETLEDILVTLSVDGIMYNFDPLVTGDKYVTQSLGDLHHDTGVTDSDNCTGVDGFDNDIATYTLTARPTVQEVTPEFIPKN